MSRPLKPSSSAVATSGNDGVRLLVRAAITLAVPARCDGSAVEM
jgi:hypothetical protein